MYPYISFVLQHFTIKYKKLTISSFLKMCIVKQNHSFTFGFTVHHHHHQYILFINKNIKKQKMYKQIFLETGMIGIFYEKYRFFYHKCRQQLSNIKAHKLKHKHTHHVFKIVNEKSFCCSNITTQTLKSS